MTGLFDTLKLAEQTSYARYAYEDIPIVVVTMSGYKSPVGCIQTFDKYQLGGIRLKSGPEGEESTIFIPYTAIDHIEEIKTPTKRS